MLPPDFRVLLFDGCLPILTNIERRVTSAEPDNVLNVVVAALTIIVTGTPIEATSVTVDQWREQELTAN